ncbi:hypothetical protein [Hymenobacter psychrotolerans]|uniref:Uncharacterized protein n=1 Tax=Hymenobacter psychrotolerans DSM 18569 TaxID=1121959 RepID=A0A1M6Z2T8_9BACT|nr:hypothetical protein [Hymenobacter psychrotolerans]SHL24609.1 hypothetical protein SAMN02746009_02400 [Hymenobacter psychrotolerans DSM 18569]
MLDKHPIAEYPSTQAALWQRSLDLHPALLRDAALLATRGVTAARIQTFIDDTAEFGEMDPDTVLQQEGATVTAEKDAVRSSLETAMQQVLGIIGAQDPPRTARYKRFGASNVENLSDAKLHLAATMLVKQGRKYLAEYAGVGLTEQMLKGIETQNADFVEHLTDRKEAESTRAGATRARILFANGLYRQLVQLCAIGEAYWKLTDATKAAEYVVHPTVAPAVPAQ